GYRPRPSLASHVVSYYGRGTHQHHVPLAHSGRPLPVELHRRLILGIEPASSGDVIARSVRSEAGSHRVPDATDLLFHIAVHFAEHRRGGGSGALGQLADVAHTIDRAPVDWEALVSRSRAYRLSGAVF